MKNMKSVKNGVKRAAIITTVTAAGLALACVPSHAGEGVPRVTVTDRPGAPGEMLHELEELTREPLGVLDRVLAFDTAGQTLSIDQLAALAGGEDVEGVEVLGVMPGSRELLETTMADLADGTFDGDAGSETSTSTLIFVTSIPGSRDWCLTMCIASGKTVRECILARMDGDEFLTLGLSGDTTLEETKAAFERANEVSLGDPEIVETLVGEGEPSAEDIRMLLAGKDIDSLQRVATVERPDLTWALADVAEQSGVMYAKTRAHIFSFSVPWIGKILAVCISHDDGKTWKCTARQWDGF